MVLSPFSTTRPTTVEVSPDGDTMNHGWVTVHLTWEPTVRSTAGIQAWPKRTLTPSLSTTGDTEASLSHTLKNGGIIKSTPKISRKHSNHHHLPLVVRGGVSEAALSYGWLQWFGMLANCLGANLNYLRQNVTGSRLRHYIEMRHVPLLRRIMPDVIGWRFKITALKALLHMTCSWCLCCQECCKTLTDWLMRRQSRNIWSELVFVFFLLQNVLPGLFLFRIVFSCCINVLF